jgi:hypothetical protein
VRDLPADLGKSATEYLLDLRDRLAFANNLATSQAETVQSKYSARYNVRSRDKHFNIGETMKNSFIHVSVFFFKVKFCLGHNTGLS